MSAANGKSRMVSFRLNPAEYEQFRRVCFATGANNVSEFFRKAMTRFLENESRAIPLNGSLERRLADLESELQSLQAELRRRNP